MKKTVFHIFLQTNIFNLEISDVKSCLSFKNSQILAFKLKYTDCIKRCLYIAHWHSFVGGMCCSLFYS